MSDILTRDGYHISVVQQPLTSFQEDVAATKRILALQDGPVVSEADGKRFPSDLSRSTAIRLTPDSFSYLNPAQFHPYFADMSAEQVALAARSQVLIANANFSGVITTPAWRGKPSWMVVATKERVINPELER